MQKTKLAITLAAIAAVVAVLIGVTSAQLANAQAQTVNPIQTVAPWYLNGNVANQASYSQNTTVPYCYNITGTVPPCYNSTGTNTPDCVNGIATGSWIGPQGCHGYGAAQGTNQNLPQRGLGMGMHGSGW